MSKKGYKQTMEHIEKRNSRTYGFEKGCVPWNKGKKLSQKHINNLSESHKGYNMPEEQKKKISEKLNQMFKEGKLKTQIGKSGSEANNWKGGKCLNKICPDCDGEMNYRSKRCKDCNYKSKVGKNAPNWKGGKTKKIKSIRNSKEYIEWREAVFIRDDYTCQKCFVRGGYLHAHHIKQAAFYPEIMLDVNNGITLCENCHRDIPVILRLKKEQFEVDTA